MGERQIESYLLAHTAIFEDDDAVRLHLHGFDAGILKVAPTSLRGDRDALVGEVSHPGADVTPLRRRFLSGLLVLPHVVANGAHDGGGQQQGGPKGKKTASTRLSLCCVEGIEPTGISMGDKLTRAWRNP